MLKKISIILVLLILSPYILHGAKRIRLVDINIDSAQTLSQIPDINKKLAELIIKQRIKNDYFSSLEDLLEIPEIDDELLNKIKPYLSITNRKEIQWEKNLERIEENLEDSDAAGETDDEIEDLDTLESLSLNPLNINNATKSQLLYLPYIDSSIVEAILRYRKTNNGFKYMNELRTLIGAEIFSQIKPYVAIYRQDIAEEFRGDLVIKYNMRAYPLSEGYLESESKYNNPAEIYSRLRAYGGNRLELGMVMRRDDGSTGLSYYDTMNYHLMKKYLLMRNVLFWDTVVVGDYELSFGQGLILYASPNWSSIPKKPKGIQGDRSDDNNDRFYGISALRELPNLELYGFYSNKPLIVDDINSDGTVGDEADDIFGNKTLSYYDADRYPNVDYLNVTLYGGRFKYFLTSTLTLGSIIYKEEFDQIVDPVESDGEYKDWAYMFRGDKVEIYSFDAEYSYYNLRQFITVGKSRSHIFTRTDDAAERNWETSRDTAWESLTTLQIEKFKFWLNYHYIGPEFYAFHNQPLHAIYAANRNERGELFGVEYKVPGLESSVVLKYGDYIVEDLNAAERQEDEMRVTAKLRYKPSRTFEIYLYGTQTSEYKQESDISSIIDDDKITYYTNLRKIQLAYMPDDTAYIKCGYYISENSYEGVALYADGYPKQTIYTKLKYKPTSRLTLYNSFKYTFAADGEADIYWNINPKIKLSKHAKLYLTYGFNMTTPEHTYSVQYNCSW